MSSPPSSFLTLLWRRYKSLRLPWRRRWLAGVDLNNNQYYYFRPSKSAPVRRMLGKGGVGFSGGRESLYQYSDLQIPPQWYQWLHYTRSEPPSVQEQEADAIRQQNLKVLAQRADERWKSKESMLDMPRRGNLALGVGDGEREGTVGRRWDPGPTTAKDEAAEKPRTRQEQRERSEQVDMGPMQEGRESPRKDPWGKPRGTPGQDYTPQTWVPPSTKP